MISPSVVILPWRESAEFLRRRAEGRGSTPVIHPPADQRRLRALAGLFERIRRDAVPLTTVLDHLFRAARSTRSAPVQWRLLKSRANRVITHSEEAIRLAHSRGHGPLGEKMVWLERAVLVTSRDETTPMPPVVVDPRWLLAHGMSRLRVEGTCRIDFGGDASVDPVISIQLSVRPDRRR